jgi:hypothetical protein
MIAARPSFAAGLAARGRVLRVGIAAAAAAAIAGCGFFETRDPQEGSAEDSFWRPPTSPEIIVANLVVAFENQIFNDYRRALTEDFVFRPDPADSVQISIDTGGAPVFVNWDRDVEVATAEQIAAGADSIDVNLALGTDEIVGDNDHLLKQAYRLTILRGEATEVYDGEVWLWIRQVANGEWYIYRWEDIRSVPPPAVSWGYLKGDRRI